MHSYDYPDMVLYFHFHPKIAETSHVFSRAIKSTDWKEKIYEND